MRPEGNRLLWFFFAELASSLAQLPLFENAGRARLSWRAGWRRARAGGDKSSSRIDEVGGVGEVDEVDEVGNRRRVRAEEPTKRLKDEDVGSVR